MSNLSFRSLKASMQRTAGGCGLLLIALGCVARNGFSSEPDFLAPPQYLGPPQAAARGHPPRVSRHSQPGRLARRTALGELVRGQDSERGPEQLRGAFHQRRRRRHLARGARRRSRRRRPAARLRSGTLDGPGRKTPRVLGPGPGTRSHRGRRLVPGNRRRGVGTPSLGQAGAHHQWRDDVQAAGAQVGPMGTARLHVAQHRPERQTGRLHRPGPDLGGPGRLQRAGSGSGVR